MELFRTVAVIALTVVPAFAVPVSNATNTEPMFRPEPTGRGTVGLVTTCFATYFLCVWTAVHPNIIAKPSVWRTSVYKITMMVVSVCLPEGLILCAYGQLRQAMRVRHAWLTHFGIKKGDKGDIGIGGGFFVVMGGIAAGEKGDRTILTAIGFEKYLSRGQIQRTDLCKHIITDKGKADIVVKMLVFIQTSWFVIGCFMRLAEDLPVTLLEVHVVIQVFSGLVVYLFWFHKPLDVRDPIHLDICLDPPRDSTWGLMAGAEFPETTIWDTQREYTTADSRSGILNPILTAISDTAECIGQTYRNVFRTAFLITINGACHATSWNSQFPTAVEGHLWRVACIVLCVLPWLQAFLLQFNGHNERYFRVVWELRFPKRSVFKHWSSVITRSLLEMFGLILGKDQGLSVWSIVMIPARICMFFWCMVLGTCYIASVLYIAVESVYSIRSVPFGSYSTPVWSNYVPQI